MAYFPLLAGDIFPDMQLKDLKASNSVHRNIPKLSLVMKKTAVLAPFWLVSFTLYSLSCMLYIFFDEKCHVISEKKHVTKMHVVPMCIVEPKITRVI